MSYSFGVVGKTKNETAEAVQVQLDKVLEAQPVHEADVTQALTAAILFLNVLPDVQEGEQYTVSMSGSTYAVDGRLYNACVSVTASITKVPAA